MKRKSGARISIIQPFKIYDLYKVFKIFIYENTINYFVYFLKHLMLIINLIDTVRTRYNEPSSLMVLVHYNENSKK